MSFAGISLKGLPRWLSSKTNKQTKNKQKKNPTCQGRSHRKLEFDPWVLKIPWRKKWQPTPVFLPLKSYG